MGEAPDTQDSPALMQDAAHLRSRATHIVHSLTHSQVVDALPRNSGDHSPLKLKTSTKREAQDLLELLLKAISGTLSRGHRTASPEHMFSELPRLHAHSDAWERERDDVGVLSLCCIEEAAIPLISALYSGPRKSELVRASR